jgi:hypothetical protein
MKIHFRSFAFLVACAVIFAVVLVGCKRPPTPNVQTNGNKDGHKDLFKPFVEAARYNPGTGDDWTRFRDGVRLLDNHFNKPEVIKRVALSAAERKFLEDDAHLGADDFAEVEATAFRKADSHYLDECYLLRDAVRAAEVPNLTNVEQARFLFGWVMRNVLLHDQVDTWIPPAFILRRGCGSALDRALVFLAAARQAKLEGCLIVVPDAEPTQILVGIREPQSTAVRLFDPRLGLAVAGKKGGVATLSDVIADPALLEPSGITKEQAAKLEVRLICPLYALAPRMLELQKGCASIDPIVLHLDAPALAADLAKTTKLPVKVWNPPESKTVANSPTRELHLFLPKQEGGTDSGLRFLDYHGARTPQANVMANLDPFGVSPKQLPRAAWDDFSRRIIEDLFNKYDIQPREMYLRGHRDAMARRQERMELFVDNPALKGLATDRATAIEIAVWLNKVSEAYAGVDLKQKGAAQKAMASIWSDDTFMARLILVDKDEHAIRHAGPNEQLKRTVLTKIVAIGTRDYFDFELAHTRALANHEQAERVQATADATRANDQIRKRAASAWSEAKSPWSNYYIDRISLSGKIEQGLQQSRRFLPAMRTAEDVQFLEYRMGIVENLHFDVHKYFDAKVRYAECKAHTENAKASAAYLEETKREIEDMERQAQLKGEIDILVQLIRGLQEPLRARYQKRLDLLMNDWSANGNYSWIKRQIDRRIAGVH